MIQNLILFKLCSWIIKEEYMREAMCNRMKVYEDETV